jgi:hypothetical protein
MVSDASEELHNLLNSTSFGTSIFKPVYKVISPKPRTGSQLIAGSVQLVGLMHPPKAF